MRFWFALLSFMALEVHALDLQYFKFTHNPTYSSTDNALLNEGITRNDYPWLLNVSYDYVKTPLSIEKDNNREEELVENMQSLSFGGAWHPTEDFLVGVRTRFSHLKADESGSYLGDSFIDAIWKFYEEDRNAIALHPRLTVPTGSNDYTSQNSKVGGYLGLNFERKFDWFQAVINLGYSKEPGATLSLGPDFSEIDYTDAIFTAVGTLFPIAENWGLNIEAYRYNNFSGNQHPNEVYAGLRHQINHDWAGFGGVATGGLVDESSNDYRLSLGVKWYPGEEKKPVEKAAPVLVADKKTEPVVSKRDEVLKKESALHGKLILQQNVYFANGSSKLNALSQALLAKMASKVKGKENSMTIVLEGFASTSGNPDSNLILSQKRAQEVKNYLKIQGVGDSNVKIVAYGDSRADAGVDDALNRKVMMRVYNK
jgi:outer membrane protein OmpA-like peptidoglycan-associated protein